MPNSRTPSAKKAMRARSGERVLPARGPPQGNGARSDMAYQSANDALTILNTQLQETLARQRTTSNDLQNILYSTNVATIFLDTAFNIRFFTPATKLLFSIVPGDLGRPLAGLSSLAADSTLLADARTVLKALTPIEREIEARSGAWYIRRVLPYRTQDDEIEGVVITFVDSTERKHTADALEAAKRQAQLATIAKSRFLGAASHDLRQPLQTLALLQGLLARSVEGERAQKLVARVDETLGAMSGMLNTLLDINQIEAGTVHPEKTVVPLGTLLERLGGEFSYLAQAQKLALRVVPGSLEVHTDPRLLEQMIRNLLSNALKYTKHGKILLGCRRRAGVVSIEIWDTGVGIPEGETQAIFEEYHQLDNGARERSRGLGLGLAIVQRLATMLDHRIWVKSWPDKGSVFAIEIGLSSESISPSVEVHRGGGPDLEHRTGTILIVEDDPETRTLLELLLRDEGHRTATAPDAAVALALVAQGIARPDLILSDYNLPNAVNGLQLTAKLRDQFRRPIPAIILTADISTETLRAIARADCVQVNKPMKLKELAQVIQRLLAQPQASEVARAPRLIDTAVGAALPTIFIVDDDRHIRAALRSVLEEDGHVVVDYESCEAFLEAYRPGQEACLLVDGYLPGMNGLELLHRLTAAGHRLPAIMITGDSDVHMAVQAMKAGASDFIEKPVGRGDLLACVDRALEQARDAGKLSAWRDSAASHVAGLTARERQIMDLVLAGHPSKNIAADLGISQRTVENHRAAVMRKTGSKSLPALARLALAAGSDRA